jgi:prepilin-type N-terminal cleavage/methylation domain-containing protein
MSHSLIARVRARPSLGPENGFTLIEVMVAMGIMLVALLALAYTATIGFSDIALARQRQGANGLADQAIEQLRALPFDKLQHALDNADLAAGGDSAITSTGSGASLTYWYAGEQITHGDNAALVPLVPHRRTVTVGPTSYTVASYVTYYLNNLTSNIFRVTVLVSWQHAARGGVSSRVQTQTLVHSPAGCVSTATHPYAAPCQPFLYASAWGNQGHIDVSPADDTGVNPGIAGIDLDHASLVLPGATSNIQIEQVSAVQGMGRTSGLELQLVDGDLQSVGQQVVSSSADNDPSQTGQDWDSTSISGQSTGSHSASGGSNSITLTSTASGGGDTAKSTSTPVATTSPSRPCPNITGITDQNDSQPCGGSTGTQTSTLSMGVGLNTGTTALGSATFASVGVSTGPVRAITDRALETGADGKVHEELARTLGQVSLGGLPANLSSGLVPTGWLGYFIRITGFTDTAVSEAGTSSSSPTVTASGTISYWNGAGYSTHTVAPGAAWGVPVASVHIVGSGSPQLKIDITGSMDGAVNCAPTWVQGCPATGGTVTSSTSAVCSPACPTKLTASSASSGAPLLADVRYKVTFGTTVLADLAIHVDLGSLLATGTYKLPPSSG